MIIIDDNFKDDIYSKFIYRNNESLSPEICKEIIEIFEASNKKYNGCTIGGVQKSIKNTTDLLMGDSEWDKINILLRNELYYNLKKHLSKLNTSEDFKSKYNNTTVDDYKINFDNISIDQFMTQKYKANDGRYVYHTDSLIELSKSRSRFMTYLWYLNDVVEGGETTFYGEYQIKPTTGKLILFPSCWTFPHCGKMPVSSDKYIITGWIYTTSNSIN
jgi:hypothetical protein